ncbi:MAG: preprotein translocase subunit SecG [Bacteroidales bacterium]|nr:preprotein translocase subunit SecG [Bacteroidales bacterium]
MYTVIVILILVVSVLLGLVVLVQNSKGGGLISNFGSANQMMGVRQTTDFLEKATWTMAIILVVLCLMSSMSIKTGVSGSVQDSQMREQIELNTPAVPAPTADAPAE